jgi:hypothetical protein
MGTYRCLGCREYHRKPAHRDIGLGSVCSDACASDLSRRSVKRSTKKGPDTVPTLAAIAVRTRDAGRCRYCGITRGLHTHHIRYRSEGIDHSVSNLITLCQEHHALVHSNKRRWQPVCLAYVETVQTGRRRFLYEIDRDLTKARTPDATPR